MPLVDLNLTIGDVPLPGDVRRFLREAESRIEQFQQAGSVPAFVPSDYDGAYRVLRALAETGQMRGRLFCEWGSGFGVVACLAAMLDFDAQGIEIEGDLVEAARQLADDFGLPVEFVRDSFIPPAAGPYLDRGDDFGWLSTEQGSDAGESGLAADDLDVIFAYPWPDEERFTEELFERYAAVGAVLVTYHGGNGFRVRRKVADGRRRPKMVGKRRPPDYPGS